MNMNKYMKRCIEIDRKFCFNGWSTPRGGAADLHFVMHF